jgi:hypothetical protein
VRSSSIPWETLMALKAGTFLTSALASYITLSWANAATRDRLIKAINKSFFIIIDGLEGSTNED